MSQVSVLYGTLDEPKTAFCTFIAYLLHYCKYTFFILNGIALRKYARPAVKFLPDACLGRGNNCSVSCSRLFLSTFDYVSHCSASLIFQSSNSQTIWAIVKSVLLLDYYILQMVWSLHCLLWLFYCSGLAKTNGIGYQFLLYDFLLAHW